jgi:hypothetical protein
MSKPVTNNVDIAKLKVKQLQSMIYDSNKSREDLFNFTKDILVSMDAASIEIQTNFEEISKQLTKKMRGEI